MPAIPLLHERPHCCLREQALWRTTTRSPDTQTPSHSEKHMPSRCSVLLRLWCWKEDLWTVLEGGGRGRHEGDEGGGLGHQWTHTPECGNVICMWDGSGPWKFFINYFKSLSLRRVFSCFWNRCVTFEYVVYIVCSVLTTFIARLIKSNQKNDSLKKKCFDGKRLNMPWHKASQINALIQR